MPALAVGLTGLDVLAGTPARVLSTAQQFFRVVNAGLAALPAAVEGDQVEPHSSGPHLVATMGPGVAWLRVIPAGGPAATCNVEGDAATCGHLLAASGFVRVVTA